MANSDVLSEVRTGAGSAGSESADSLGKTPRAQGPGFDLPEGVEVRGDWIESSRRMLTFESLSFLATLHRRFERTRQELLAARVARQKDLDTGEARFLPKFLESTRWIRDADWKVAPVPTDLIDRRVEITGPVDRKMVINALNSGARVFMADFEDSHSPTWRATMEGQVNLFDAVRRSIRYKSENGEGGKEYILQDKTAVLVVRPRGWHLSEAHLWVDSTPMSASLVDFGLYFFWNAKELISRSTGPYFYLAKLESHLEAKLWNSVFVAAQESLALPVGTIKATVLIETILAAFEMDEILYELRDHVVGLNCGRWDYIFSYIKKFRAFPDKVLPDRSQVTMSVPFLKAYSQLLIKTCHRRGAHAMGGMAAQIPIKGDPLANEAALEKVRADKLREVTSGHDGTWVAHPALVEVAMKVFNEHMKTPNQVHLKFDEYRIVEADLVSPPAGTVTESGLRTNLSVGLQYVEAWLRGVGCVPIYHLMEDAATAEISRAQVWQWIRHPKGILADGRRVTLEWVRMLLKEEFERLRSSIESARPGEWKQRKFALAMELFNQMIAQEEFSEFLTLKAYTFLD